MTPDEYAAFKARYAKAANVIWVDHDGIVGNGVLNQILGEDISALIAEIERLQGEWQWGVRYGEGDDAHDAWLTSEVVARAAAAAVPERMLTLVRRRVGPVEPAATDEARS